MNESVTLLGPAAPSTGGSRVSDLPRDLLEQVRGRVRLLALLLLVAFAVGPVLFGVSWVVGTLLSDHAPPEFYARKGFVMADAAAAIASAGIWWVARSAGRGRARDGELPARRVARPRRHGRGLARAASHAGAARGDQAH